MIAGNLLGLLTGRAPVASPAFITWAVSTECQCRCRHCLMVRRPAAALKDQRLLASRIADSRAWGVSLIGGEPLLVPGILDCAADLKAAGKRVSIGTNGALLKELAGDIIAAGVDTVNVSVDSHLARRHDSILTLPSRTVRWRTFISSDFA